MVAVGHLLLYSPLLPPVQATKPSGDKDEDAHEAAQVAFYSSSDNVGTRDGMLRSLGLAKGLENFVDMISPAKSTGQPDDGEIANDGTTVVTSTASTMLTLTLEASFKLHVRFAVSSPPPLTQGEPSALVDPLPPVSALKAVMRQACERFYLLHGPLSGLLPASCPEDESEADMRARRKLRSAVERYWSEWIERFAVRASSLLADSHGLALPSIVAAPIGAEADLPAPYALLSPTRITASPSKQLPVELLHHLLSLVPPPADQESGPEVSREASGPHKDSKRGNGTAISSWWDGLGGLGSGMSSLTLGLGKSSSSSTARAAPPPPAVTVTERKSSFPSSSLWKKATVDLLSFGSSTPPTPAPARLPPRLQDPKTAVAASDNSASTSAVSPPLASPLELSTSQKPLDDAVDESTLKEAMEQALPPPEPVTLRWSETPVWLQEHGQRRMRKVAMTLLPEESTPSSTRKLFAYLPSSVDAAQHPSLEVLRTALEPSKAPRPPTAEPVASNGLQPENSVDHRSFTTSPTKPTLSRSPSAVSLLSTFSTPPRPALAPSPVKNAPVSALVRLNGGEALMNGPWKHKGGRGSRRERSVICGLDLLHGPEVQEAVTRTSLASTWIAARRTSSVADGELVTLVESKGISLGDVTRFSRQAEREFDRQLASREAGGGR